MSLDRLTRKVAGADTGAAAGAEGTAGPAILGAALVLAQPDFSFELITRVIRRARLATRTARNIALLDVAQAEALDRMLAGNVSDLHVVRSYLAQLFADHALLPEGFATRVLLSWDDSGRLSGVQTGVECPADAPRAIGLVVPGLPNLHSHAFQRAFAGLTEYRASAHDSFWSWRKLMYRFAGVLAPDQLRDIATALYVEMNDRGKRMGMQWGELSWTLEDNDGINRGIERMGAVNLAAVEDHAELAGRIAGLEAQQADALLVCTEWQQFRAPDFDLIKSQLRQAVIFDGRNLFDTDAIKELGFFYESVGRATAVPGNGGQHK